MTSERKTQIILAAVIFCAFLIRVIPAFNALDFPERFCRPDTPTYLEPAQLLLEGKFFGTGRAPGYILFAAFAQRLSFAYHPFLLALWGVILSSLTVIPVYAAAKELFGRRAGVGAGTLWAFSLTAISNAPMLLSDTLFAFFAAWQFFFLLRGV